MHLIYVLGEGSNWLDNELRYSLRSVQAYGQNVNKITVVGKLPTWLKNVDHIPCDDPFTRKIDNVWNKLNLICLRIPGQVVIMNDDFFLIKDVNFDKLPLYYKGTMQGSIDNDYPKPSRYLISLKHTQEVLKSLGKPTLNYDTIHVPIPIITDEFIKWFSMFPPESNLLYRSFYGNTCDQTIPRVEIKNCKLNNFKEFEDLDPERPFFSIGNGFLSTEGKEILAQLYPTSSIYEND